MKKTSQAQQFDVGDSIYSAQIDIANWFSFDSSLLHGCPPDLVSYAFQIQDSMLEIFYQFIYDLENASEDEYNNYLAAVTKFNFLANSYPNIDNSCKSRVISIYSPDILRNSYLNCAKNIEAAGTSQANNFLPKLKDFVAKCIDTVVSI